MFNEKANATFNNSKFNYWIMARMEKGTKATSTQVERLFAAAKDMAGIDVDKRGGKTALAALLGILPAAITNWSAGRPLSNDLLLTAQEKIGCDAIWLRDGTGDMTKGQVLIGLTANEIADLITLYEDADVDGRKAIMDMARAMAKLGISTRSRAANNPQ